MTETEDRLLEALKRVVGHGPLRMENGSVRRDWACSECIPHSDMVIKGFQCGYHSALNLIQDIKLVPAFVCGKCAKEILGDADIVLDDDELESTNL